MIIQIERENGEKDVIDCESYTTTVDGRWLIVIDICGNMLAYELTDNVLFLDSDNNVKPC